jgi:hypothetical protein
MTGDEQRDILLVRAAEECRPDAIPPEVLVDASAHAGHVDDESAWLARRAAFLLDAPLTDLRPLRAMPSALRGGAALLLVGPALVGLASNYLGPSAKIHVLFNPIAILIVWNLLTYAFAGALRIAWLLRTPRRRRRPGGAGRPPREDTRPPTPRASLPARLVVRRLVPSLWLRIHRAVLAGTAHATDLGTIGRRFWEHWIAAVGPALIPIGRRAMHIAAIGIALGAVLGMYARGLFFEYDVVWRSTFITDTDAFLRLIRWALGPAALVTGQHLPTETEAALLLAPKGAPAAPWIHLYAVSAILFIGAPRLLLAAFASWRARRLEGRATLDLTAAYYRTLLEHARRLQVAQVEEQIATDVREEARRFATALGDFVCDRLYDADLAPAIRAFRTDGGTVADLESVLTARCKAFRATLADQVPVQQAAFEEALTARVAARLGATPSLEPVRSADVAGTLGAVSGEASTTLGGSLGHGLADTVSAAVAAALAVVAGTMSGGFGEAIGVAVLIGILETGPVGWIVGALGGLLAAGAGWWLGRDALARGLKRVSLPASVVRLVLWQSRLDHLVADGRAHCHESVRERVEHEFDSLSAAIATEIWQRVKPVLGERQRPAGSGDEQR